MTRPPRPHERDELTRRYLLNICEALRLCIAAGHDVRVFGERDRDGAAATLTVHLGEADAFYRQLEQLNATLGDGDPTLEAEER